MFVPRLPALLMKYLFVQYLKKAESQIFIEREPFERKESKTCRNEKGSTRNNKVNKVF